MNNLYIYGAGGHAKVIIDVAQVMNNYSIIAILDDDPELHGKNFYGYPVKGGFEYLKRLNPVSDLVFVAIGKNSTRLNVAHKIAELGFSQPALIHPSAQISPSVRIGLGTVVVGGVVINADTKVSDFCILNTSCSIDHDCVLGEGVHISPGAHLAGGVEVGEKSHVGIGSSIIEYKKIGSNCVIGAGAAVINNIPDNSKVVGVPARHVK